MTPPTKKRRRWTTAERNLREDLRRLGFSEPPVSPEAWREAELARLGRTGRLGESYSPLARVWRWRLR